MSYKIAAATLVLACAFGTAGCSKNADNPSADVPSGATAAQPQTPPYPAASPGTAATAGMAGTATTAGGMAGTASTAGEMAAPGNAAGSATPFEDLAGSKGYIMQKDARRDEWLSGHFSGCDSNNDGRLTRQEYTHCTQQAGSSSSAAEGVPPASSAQ
jgi:hypothetical protein